jgi:hypothetical protein
MPENRDTPARDLICSCIEEGYIDFLKCRDSGDILTKYNNWAPQIDMQEYMQPAIHNAFRRGHVETCLWLYNTRICEFRIPPLVIMPRTRWNPIQNDPLVDAAETSQIPLLEALLPLYERELSTLALVPQRSRDGGKTYYAAGGVNWRQGFIEPVYYGALLGERLNVLEWLVQTYPGLVHASHLAPCISHNDVPFNPPVLNWLKEETLETFVVTSPAWQARYKRGQLSASTLLWFSQNLPTDFFTNDYSRGGHYYRARAHFPATIGNLIGQITTPLTPQTRVRDDA